jgi:hypothetical protein
MKSLYSRLFTYRGRENRSPKENFLTEALADFIDRSPTKLQIDFIEKLFVPREAKASWERLRDKIEKITAKTQVPADGDYIDIVLYADDEVPIIAIENKISASIGLPKSAMERKPSDRRDQLQRYGCWLKRNVTNDWPGVIVLLSHLTPPPSDFTGGNPNYRARPHAARWAEVATVLRTRKLDRRAISPDEMGPSNDAAICHSLGDELLLFLTEQNMAQEFASFEDFAAGVLYLKASARLRYTFKQIYEHVAQYKGIFNYGEKNSYSQSDNEIEFESEDNCIYGFKFLNVSLPIKGAYLGYGILLKPHLILQDATVCPKVDAAFVCIGSEKKSEAEKIKKGIDVFGRDWAYVEQFLGAYSFRPLSEMLSPPEEFTGKMIKWLDTNRAAIEKLVKTK